MESIHTTNISTEPSAIPVFSPAVPCKQCEVLQSQVHQLQTEVATLKKLAEVASAQPKRKRQTKKKKETEDGDEEEEIIEKSPKPKKQKKDADSTTKVNPSKFFKKWGNAITRKGKTSKFYYDFMGCSGEIVVDDTITPDVFHTLFDGKGKVLQPTPDNKPKSVVHIISFASWEDVETLFGKENIAQGGHQIWVWRRGGVPSRWGGGFSKACKDHQEAATIKNLEVQYNRTKMKLELKFNCNTGRPGMSYNSDGDDE